VAKISVAKISQQAAAKSATACGTFRRTQEVAKAQQAAAQLGIHDLVQQAVAQTLQKANYAASCGIIAPTIGLILCQTKDNILAEYSFTGIDKPISFSTYELTRALPKNFQSALQNIEEIEMELAEKNREDV
jgi:YhcG PDDEXK nuclease domain